MALFNKEADKNIKAEPPARPPVQPVATTAPTVAAPPPSAAAEKAATPARPTPALGEGARAYLDSGSKISGKLSFEGATRLDGQVDGEITARDSLTIGETAVITAQIKAVSIIVAGKVSGDITAAQRIEIRPSAKVLGNLTAPVLVVHEGALFEGHCSMQPEAHGDRKVTVLPKDDRAAVAAQKQA